MNIPIEPQSPGSQLARINRPLPNLFGQGFQLALRNWPLVLWAYAVNLGFALLAAIPFSTGMASFLDHSLAAQRIAGTIDVGSLGELLTHLHGSSFFSTAIHTAAWLNLLQLLVLFFLFAGATFIYVSSEPPRLSVLLRGGVAYFWRFLRAALLAGCVAAVILGILFAARALLLTRLSNVYVERKMFLYSAISAAVILLVALLVRLWWDLVEVYIVRNAMDGERRVLQSLLPALRLLGKYFFRIVGSFFLSGMLGLGALALCLYLWREFIPAHQVWLACLLAQLGLFLLLASRFWQRGIETTLILFADPPIVVAEEAAEEMDVIGEEDVPILSGVDVSPGMSEPTLRELVQKLRTEPWASPETIPVVPLHPSSEHGLAPAPGPDRPKVDDPQISRLDRHDTKYPLGGVDPATNAENPDPPATKFPLGAVDSGNEAEKTDPKANVPDDPERSPRTGRPFS